VTGITKWQYCTSHSSCAFSKCANRVVIFWRKQLVVTPLWRNYCKQQKPQTKFGADVFERGSLCGTTLMEECMQYK